MGVDAKIIIVIFIIQIIIGVYRPLNRYNMTLISGATGNCNIPP